MPSPVTPWKPIQKSASNGQEKRSTNNAGLVGLDLRKPSVKKDGEKKLPNSAEQQKHHVSKFTRPCRLHPYREQHGKQLQQNQNRILSDWAPPNSNSSGKGRQQGASNNVNQPDKKNPEVKVQPVEKPSRKTAYDKCGDAVEHVLDRQPNMKSVTSGSEDGTLRTVRTGMSLAKIKSKNASHHIAPSPIGTPPRLTPSTSASSLSTASSAPSSSTTQATSSVRAVVPPSPQSQSRRKSVTSKSSEPDGINLFRSDSSSSFQSLTVELRSKLRALNLDASLLSTRGGSAELKQLYEIYKEVVAAMKILTEREQKDRKPTDKCTCCKKRNPLTQSTNGGDDGGSKQPTKQPQPESSNTVPPTTEQRQQRLEREIKRLKTMISDKQTLHDGRIADLNRKLEEAASRYERLQQTQKETDERLLSALIDAQRLEIRLVNQSTTITNLKRNFSDIESLAHQQIDLLPDRITRGSPSNAARKTSATRGKGHDNKASTNPISSAIIDNHLRNYRHPSGGSAAISSSSPPVSSPGRSRLASAAACTDDDRLGPGMQQQSSNADTSTTTANTQENSDAYITALILEKLRKLKRHYASKIAEKESDDDHYRRH